MRPADVTPANLCSDVPTGQELVQTTTGLARTQEPAQSITIQSFEVNINRSNILVCRSEQSKREWEISALLDAGYEVDSCDSLSEYLPRVFERQLAQAAVIRFDCSNVNLNVLKKLLHIASYRQFHGMKPFFVCTEVPDDDRFKNQLHDVFKVDRIVDKATCEWKDVVFRDCFGFHSRPRGLWIVHRWWVGGTICTPGEEVFDCGVFVNGVPESLNLPMKDRVALDQFVRGRVAQSTSQWAASLNASQWVKKHGSNASGANNFKCKFSRNGVKNTIFRLCPLIAVALKKSGLDFTVDEICLAISCGKEKKYRWNPEIPVFWDHLES